MEVKERKKVEACKVIESRHQQRWEEARIFETNAPEPGTAEWNTPKYFTCFPYPYMNGRLHLGHTFTITKCEFDVGYKRMKGINTFFPFGFHCTGMPIAAASDKIKREMEDFGCPPVFPTEVEVKEEEPAEIKIQDKSKGKKSKAVAKQGSAKYQWQIMNSLGFKDDEIAKFADYDQWLTYFPPMGMADLNKMGLKVDWRRSFITTDRNPYYDSFVRWQFNHLKEKKKIAFGKRPCIFSPKTDQPCMDHDRASGEGVGPQEYTLIKMKLLKLRDGVSFKQLANKPVYFVAATLRPETMYGQTNCWISPDITYVAVETVNNEIYVCTRRAAMNMAYQEMLKSGKSVSPICELPGIDLMGAQLKAPMTSYPHVYALPMMTIKENKGTGVVTSVPSDAPDDYAALVDIQNKDALRAKYGITDEMVNYQPVPIIDVPGFGDLSAVTACENLKIKSQNDTVKLQQAKEQVYLKGFYEGVIKVGKYAGTQIQKCKEEIKADMVKNNEACSYREPEKQIISRAGDECVVAVCDQWYLDYGEPEWRAKAEECLSKMECYSDDVRNNFERTLNWLKEHACSRTYGLGTRLPWDEDWLIESLSDSTIYMAYYTVAHILQGGSMVNGHYEPNFNGSKGSPYKIKPEQMCDAVWDYIMLNGPAPSKSGIDSKTLQKMKNEFNYWYPVDCRVSGKDLVPNHLTYFLYNHVAMWDKDSSKWPQSVRANGHLMLNSEKMSKSTGNFLTLTDAIDKFSADGMRFALADSGDSVEDANFVEKTADMAVLRLYNWLELVKDVTSGKVQTRGGDPNVKLVDRVFEHEMRKAIKESDSAYSKLLFKDALKFGFFEFQAVLNKYRELCGAEGMHKGLVWKFIETQTLILCPICPHIAEEVWTILGKEGFAVQAQYPKIEEYDPVLIESSEYLAETVRDMRLKLKDRLTVKKGKKPVEVPTHATIYVAKEYPPWQAACLKLLKEGLEKNGKLSENKDIAGQLKTIPEVKKYMKKVMPYVQMVKERYELIGERALDLTSPFDEMTILNESIDYINATLESTFGLQGVQIKYATEGSGPILENSYPGHPTYEFYRVPSVPLEAVNCQTCSGSFSVFLNVQADFTGLSTRQRIAKEQKVPLDKVKLYRYESVAAARSIPNMNEIMKGKVEIGDGEQFAIDVEKKSATVNGNEIHDRLVYTVNA